MVYDLGVSVDGKRIIVVGKPVALFRLDLLGSNQ
jgi:hypothetical protein